MKYRGGTPKYLKSSTSGRNKAMKLILIIDPQFIENNRYRYSPKHFKVCRKKKKTDSFFIIPIPGAMACSEGPTIDIIIKSESLLVFSRTKTRRNLNM